MITSVVPVQNMPVQDGLIAWPLVFLLAAFLRTTHPNYFTLNRERESKPNPLSGLPTTVDQVNGSTDIRRTDRQTVVAL